MKGPVPNSSYIYLINYLSFSLVIKLISPLLGTISAANSCPASPRQGFIQNQPNNYNNYSNNNTVI